MTLYIDANVFIFASLFDESDSRTKKAQEILLSSLSGTQCFTSALTIDEVVWIWMKQKKNRDEAIKQGLRIHALRNIRILNITPEISLRSLQLMQKYPQLKPRDALHAATCMSIGISAIASDDSDFDAIKELERIQLQ